MTDPETRAIPVDVVWLVAELRGFEIDGFYDAAGVSQQFGRAATALETLAAERDAWQTRAAEHHRSIDAIHTRATAAEARAETLAAENARLREVLRSVKITASVGKRGSCVTRSKWATIPASVYHEVAAALSPVTQVKESGRG